MADYRMKKCIVAFVDILGATELIRSSHSSVQIVHRAYEDALRIFGEISNDESELPGIRIFSDNIIIFKTVGSRNPEKAFRNVVVFTSVFQGTLLVNGLLTRGGISQGKFFSDDMMIWGQALVDSYYIENNIAIYPRVVIADELIEQWLSNEDVRNLYNMLLIRDSDGLYFVDYLNYHIFSHEETIYHNTYLIIQSMIEGASNQKIAQKVKWLNRYMIEKYREFENNMEEI